MGSLSEHEKRQAFEKLQLLAFLRQKSTLSEEQIAYKLEFGSAEAMHLQLKNWGLPGWLTGASASANVEPSDVKSGRQARNAHGEAMELPPACEAQMLFHEALKTLGWAIGDLQNRKEYLQNDRFVAQDVYPHSAYWPEVGIEDGTFIAPKAGQQSPPEPLPTLIAVYILSGQPLEPLLKKLSCNPNELDTERLRKLIEGEKTSKGHKPGLKGSARLIARAVRGALVRPGATTGEFSERIQNAVWYMRLLEGRGADWPAIRAELKSRGFKPEEISQIKSLRKISCPG